MSNYQLFHGDCLEITPTLADKSIDAIICDLPYGTTACKWDSVIPFDDLWKEYKRIIKPRGAIVLFGSQPFTSALITSNLKWFKYELIWDKKYGTDWQLANIKPLKVHENIIVFGNGGIKYNPQKTLHIQPRDRTKEKNRTKAGDHKTFSSKECTTNKIHTDKFPTSILSESSQSNECNNVKRVHPTQKPVALLEYLVRTYTNEGETVLDNCVGSGTTGVACAHTGRNFIGIEKDAGYFEIAQKRISEAQPAPFEVTT